MPIICAAVALARPFAAVPNALNLPRAFVLGSSPRTTSVAQSYCGLDGEGLSGGIYGALKSLHWPPIPSATLVNRTMEYDLAGNVSRITDGTQSPAETIAYSYDDLDVRFVLLKWAASPGKEARPSALTT